MADPTNKTLIVGLSGPSSSGKTTLARLLRSVFNITPVNGRSVSLFIFHEDDFYKTDEQIPLVTVTSATHGTRELQDWDCAESIDMPLFEKTLRHVKQYGRLPEDSFSKEDQNAVGDSGVEDRVITALQDGVRRWLTNTALKPTPTHLTICLLDGFLLYPAPSPNPSIPTSITSLFDKKLFLRSTAALTTARRGARAGYVTLEGFWTDPPGYVEDIVWPNYVREHSWMFEGGDVDGGAINEDLVQGEGVVIAPGMGERKMRELVGWGVNVLMDEVRAVFRVAAPSDGRLERITTS